MEPNNIKPDKITKPIQLLAVWMAGLFLLVTAFLTAAGTIKTPNWLPIFFAISAVSIIPIFLILVFLLQTKFRPEMQEDSYYSTHLDNITRQRIPNTFNENSAHKIEPKELIEEANINVSNAEISLIKVSVNMRLQNFQVIVDKLQDLGVTITDTFGRFALPPEINIVTVGNSIDPKNLSNVLSILLDLGIVGLNTTQVLHHKGFILVGSYSIKKYVLITEVLIEKFRNATSLSDVPEAFI